MIQSLQKLIEFSGKKSYLFSVGKPTPAKLGNFLEVDVFVMLACPENILMLDEESSEYMKPIVTPFEVAVALSSTNEEQNGELVWIPRSSGPNGRWLSDFGEILEKLAASSATSPTQGLPAFSLVTGKLEASTRVKEDESGNVVSKRSNSNVIAVNSPAAIYYNSKRTFKGLDMSVKTEATVVQEGRTGIACGYTHEPSDTHSH